VEYASTKGGRFGKLIAVWRWAEHVCTIYSGYCVYIDDIWAHNLPSHLGITTSSDLPNLNLLLFPEITQCHNASDNSQRIRRRHTNVFLGRIYNI
jgi:hypothetical protein